MNAYKVIGLMSGSSLDGLDIALVHFAFGETVSFQIEKFDTLSYTKEWEIALRDSITMDGAELLKLHAAYGKYTGELVRQWMDENLFVGVDLISSHGHTVIHSPEEGISFQLGHGAWISEICKLPVLSDLRSGDISAGGQGAPIVPICDSILFSEYKVLLNLGGIANCTIRANQLFYAFDLFPFNQVLNHYARQLGMPFDDQGMLSRGGKTSSRCVALLHQLDYFKKAAPKSLDNQFSVLNVIPVLNKEIEKPEDKLSTYVSFCVEHLAVILEELECDQLEILATGGGAYHDYFIERLRDRGLQVVVPRKEIIEGKEALAMALIGAKYLHGDYNIDERFSGACRAVFSGALYMNGSNMGLTRFTRGKKSNV